ncbi:MAG: ABC transporter ATP-binding protein [Acidimicrobiales bacterium]|nr:ABC transporter ATP-binding protein [Acidimicrobiales bacterium]
MTGRAGGPPAAVLARDVSVTYGTRVALRSVSFAAGWSELIAVIGPNGAGKSTLFKALCGLVPADGELAVGGDGCHHQRSTRAKVAFLPQRADVDLHFPITVEQLVLTGRRPHLPPWRRPRHIDRQAVAGALERVGLTDRGRDPIGTLSGGQAQRAFVARALTQEAGVLLLDEPMAGLDLPSTTDLIHLLRSLADDGRTVLVATHDLALTRHHFARCLAINGRLVADGSPDQVLDADTLDATFGSGTDLADLTVAAV